MGVHLIDTKKCIFLSEKYLISKKNALFIKIILFWALNFMFLSKMNYFH